MATLRQAASASAGKSDIRGVVVRGRGAGLSQEIVVGPHRMFADTRKYMPLIAPIAKAKRRCWI
jgi:hypothetical protein